jgi:hypothetical protein
MAVVFMAAAASTIASPPGNAPVYVIRSARFGSALVWLLSKKGEETTIPVLCLTAFTPNLFGKTARGALQ